MLLQINQIYQRHLDSPFIPIVFKFPWGLTTTSFYNDRWGKIYWTFNTNLLPDCVACIKVFLVDFILKFEPSFCNSTSMRKRKLSKQKGFFPQQYIGSTFITNFLKAYFGFFKTCFDPSEAKFCWGETSFVEMDGFVQVSLPSFQVWRAIKFFTRHHFRWKNRKTERAQNKSEN